ncbi:tail fiber assembly protein [Rhodospirillaceae bacterium SYSU D60014]|uniref:tail fiber assembly protein n=1 Tax=Virgifigura deserti TaxID=2268457 RepID=UPI000E673AC6
MPKYFMTVDADGRLTGAYSDANKSIPDGAIEVDKATHSEWVQNQETRRWNAGRLEVCDPPVHVPTWEQIRAKRDHLLRQSDWTQVPDAPVDKEAWATYRQALRDVPQTYDDAALVVWPERP